MRRTDESLDFNLLEDAASTAVTDRIFGELWKREVMNHLDVICRNYLG